MTLPSPSQAKGGGGGAGGGGGCSRRERFLQVSQEPDVTGKPSRSHHHPPHSSAHPKENRDSERERFLL